MEGARVVEGIDLEVVKQVQQRIWSDGDFAKVGELHVIVSEELCEAADIFPGERVLDVACGSGNTAMAAARRSWAKVIGIDYVPELIARARERAAVEQLEIEFIEGDAESLPFEDGSFDVVMSTFGAMFAPNQPRAAAELLRVCSPGGRIAMANWTPDGFVGEMFKTISAHAPLPPGVEPPIRWGTEARLRELFGDGITELRLEPTHMQSRYPSADAWLDYFRTWFGPMKMAFARVGSEGEEALATDLRALVERFDRGGGRAMVVPAEYLEVVAVRA
jgi:ubiquinone/menaquinone biosynthesis C-methylase UbiE